MSSTNPQQFPGQPQFQNGGPIAGPGSITGGPMPGGTDPRLAGGGPPSPKAGMLDLRFTRFLSLTLISVWWVVALIAIGIGAVVGVIAGFVQMGDSVGIGILWVLGSIVGGVVLAVLTRLFLESVAVLFRIADNTLDIARRSTRL